MCECNTVPTKNKIQKGEFLLAFFYACLTPSKFNHWSLSTKFYNYKINKSPRIVIYKYDLQKFINNIKINSVDYLIHAAAITNPKNKRIKKKLMDINLSLILSSLNLAKNWMLKSITLLVLQQYMVIMTTF